VITKPGQGFVSTIWKNAFELEQLVTQKIRGANTARYKQISKRRFWYYVSTPVQRNEQHEETVVASKNAWNLD